MAWYSWYDMGENVAAASRLSSHVMIHTSVPIPPRAGIVHHLGLDNTLVIIVVRVAVPRAAVVVVIVVPAIAVAVPSVLALPLDLADTVLACTTNRVRQLDELENVILFGNRNSQPHLNKSFVKGGGGLT